MQNTPQQPPKNSKWNEVWQIIWRAVKNNLGFKILALVIAIVMWSGLITQDPTLTREKTFNDVKITVAGSDAIKRNGMVVVSDLDEITYRAMMGEYVLYYGGKVVGGIYDNRLLVKPTPSAVALMSEAPRELPYEGAKEMLLVENIEDRKFLEKLFAAMYPELPEPKKKR